jgi:hypothetical protein
MKQSAPDLAGRHPRGATEGEAEIRSDRSSEPDQFDRHLSGNQLDQQLARETRLSRLFGQSQQEVAYASVPSVEAGHKMLISQLRQPIEQLEDGGRVQLAR